MNGADVFTFVIREVPRDFRSLLEFSGIGISDIDFFVFHQANSYINGFLANKLKIPEDRIPSTIEKFGNTSSVSIPLTIVSELRYQFNTKKKLLLSGFGVGLTWGTALIDMEACHISEIVEI
jgi:3-oxoacyl-[acyl-carrier-protein] synthase-3